MIYLFSYGTLQDSKVQQALFGRVFSGQKDSVAGYSINMLEITDPDVLAKSGQKYHPILEYTGNPDDRAQGILYEITHEELLQADAYEVGDYKRVETVFGSGKSGFLYIKK